MIEDILGNARRAITGLAESVGEGTRDKTMAVIENWLTIFPQLAVYGLEITSFSMALAISPSLNVELLGRHADWRMDALKERMSFHKGEAALQTVFTAIRTTYQLQAKTQAPLRDPLILKIIIRINPEVRVVLGQPVLED